MAKSSGVLFKYLLSAAGFGGFRKGYIEQRTSWNLDRHKEEANRSGLEWKELGRTRSTRRLKEP